MNEGTKELNIFLSRKTDQAKDFTESLKDLPCDVFCVPVIQTQLWDKPENESILDRLSSFDWLFFTSAKGVHFFHETIASLGYTTKLLKEKNIAAVGTGTARALEQTGLTVDFIPGTFDAEHMGNEFLHTENPEHVLLIKGELSKTTIDEKFDEHGITYENMFVYRTVINEDEKEHLHQLFHKKPFHYYVFTSPSSIQAFFELLEEDTDDIFDRPCFCIGKTTEDEAIQTGFKNTYVPKEYTLKGLAEHVRQLIEEGNDEF